MRLLSRAATNLDFYWISYKPIAKRNQFITYANRTDKALCGLGIVARVVQT